MTTISKASHANTPWSTFKALLWHYRGLVAANVLCYAVGIAATIFVLSTHH